MNQAAGSVVEYEPTAAAIDFRLEHAAALPNLLGGYELFLAAVRAEARIADAIRAGGGVRWGEHDADLFEGTERFFRPGYEQNLVSTWLPALDGVVARLKDRR